ncbi:MAG: PHP domain-containing protein [Archaeoglobaceae archaeon]
MIDLHVHSNYSDGKASVAEIAKRAKQLGLKAVGIVDHSIELSFGLDERKARLREIEIENARALYGIKIYSGIECSVNSFGEIYRPFFDFDLIIVSVHDGTFNCLDRIIKCIENYDVHAIGHLFSEMFSCNRNEEAEEKLLDVLESRGVAIELNSRHRCPPDDFLLKCSEREIKISIGSDAHSIEKVGRVEWCVEKAKRYLKRAKILEI